MNLLPISIATAILVASLQSQPPILPALNSDEEIEFPNLIVSGVQRYEKGC